MHVLVTHLLVPPCGALTALVQIAQFAHFSRPQHSYNLLYMYDILTQYTCDGMLVQWCRLFVRFVK